MSRPEDLRRLAEALEAKAGTTANAKLRHQLLRMAAEYRDLAESPELEEVRSFDPWTRFG